MNEATGKQMNTPKLRCIDKLSLRKPKDYNFALSASVYNFSWWFNGEVLLIPLNDIVFLVRDSGEELDVRLYASHTLDSDTIDNAFKSIDHILGLKEDLSEFYKIMARDPLLSSSLEDLRGMHMRVSTPWIATIVGVCQQNASFKQGWRIFYNFVRLLGKTAVVENILTYIPPSFEEIREDKVDILKEAGFGYRVKTVLNVADKFNKDPSLDKWDINPTYLEKQLLEVKGIGSYTSRLALVLSLRFYDKPPIDRWLKRLVAEVYNVSEKDVERFYIGIWGKWSGLAALYTTVALDAEPLSKALERIKRKILKPNPQRFSPLTMWRYL